MAGEREESALLGRLVFDWVTEQLPEDWEFRILAREGELDLDLFSPEGDEVEFCDDDLNVSEMIVLRVIYARVTDGLGADPGTGFECFLPYQRAEMLYSQAQQMVADAEEHAPVIIIE